MNVDGESQRARSRGPVDAATDRVPLPVRRDAAVKLGSEEPHISSLDSVPWRDASDVRHSVLGPIGILMCG